MNRNTLVKLKQLQRSFVVAFIKRFMHLKKIVQINFIVAFIYFIIAYVPTA